MAALYPRWGTVAANGPALRRHIVSDDDVALCGVALAAIDLPPERIYQIDRVCGACCDRLVRFVEYDD